VARQDPGSHGTELPKGNQGRRGHRPAGPRRGRCAALRILRLSPVLFILTACCGPVWGAGAAAPGASEDPLGCTALAPATRDSAAAPADSAASSVPRADAPLDPRVEIACGLEFEGLDQSFGFETWFDPAASWPVEEDLELLRSWMREAELLGLLEILARTPGSQAWDARVQLETRWGPERQSLAAEGEGVWNSGALRGLSLRNHLQLDSEEDGGDAGGQATSGQELFQCRWKHPLGESLRGIVRGEADVSWSDQDDAAEDSLGALYAYFLDYRKVSAGIGITTSGAGSASAYLDFTRKRATASGGGSYDAGALELLCGGFSAAGLWSVGVRGERRYYPVAVDSLAEYSSVLRSYWEADLTSVWQRLFGAFEIKGSLELTGTRYDRVASGDSLDADLGTLGIDADRLRLDGELLAAHDLLGLDISDAMLLGQGAGRAGQAWVQSLRCGAGLTGERLWLDGATGEYTSLGAKAELSLSAGPALGEAWCEASVEAGRRDYLGGGDALVFDVGGFSFSFAQSDYTFLSVSLLAAGRLPFALEWECYGFLEEERHEAGEDDARLVSLNLALKRRWSLVD
jgi:hypothetical protein